LAAVLAVILLAGYIYLSTFEGSRAEQIGFLVDGNKELLTFAHRGGAKEAPENTFAAFENAVDKGIDVLEFDIRVSKDREFVVFHDSALRRTTGNHGLVSNTKVADLKKLDAGYSFTNDKGASYPFRGKGITIPTLREVFEKYSEVPMNIELKVNNPAQIKPFCALLAEFKRENSVIIASTHTENLDAVRRDCKDIATSASVTEGIWFTFLYQIGLSGTFETDMQAMQIPASFFGGLFFTKGLVEAAHERGTKVHVFTINDDAEFERMKDFGVDGIMTDRPSIISGQ
jgi:glycerophosphoryl diester phosphodiesterase